MEKIRSLGLKELRKLAFKMGQQALEHPIRIGLIGNLGSGKTTFSKSFGKAFGITRVKSPTFIIASTYKSKHRLLHHIDLYRLNDPSELAAIGMDEILSQKENVVLIEWVDKFDKLQKWCDITIKFTVLANNKRDVTITRN